MMKAIRISKENKRKLEQDYGMDPGELDISGGMYLITEFGADRAHSILSPARYKMQYTDNGPIKNGFRAVARKAAA